MTVNVINEDEAGGVTLSSVQPQVGTPLTSTLRDPDGGISNQTWQWAQSSSKTGSYTSIAGATAASYTPATGNLGKYLRVTVSYSDLFGAGKSAQVASTNGTRAAPPSNRGPSFPASTASRSVAENTPAGRNIGSPVTASDPDTGDALTYSLGGTNAASFRIAASSGQLLTRAPMDYENKNSYAVTVTAADPSGLSDDISVTIGVTDENEPPDKPAAPTVVAASVNGDNNLGVAWAAPSNTGPAISGYDLEHRKQGAIAWDASNLTVSGTLATITGLTADSGYEARVRAENAEGAGEWSEPGTGRTRITPIHLQGHLTASFQEQTYTVSEGSAVTVTVTLDLPADRSLQIPVNVARGSAERGDYRLSGLSSNNLSLAPGESSGSFTVSALEDSDLDDETLELSFGTLPAKVTAGPSGTARVIISDDGLQSGADGQGDEDDSDPPDWNNNPPEFIEGLSTERSVKEEVPLGANIGLPVTATDEDQDPLTYSLSGFHGPYFDIESSTGRLKTKRWLNFETKNTYVVVVEVSEDRRGSDSIVVTINVIDIEGDAVDVIETPHDELETESTVETQILDAHNPTPTPRPAPVARAVARVVVSDVGRQRNPAPPRPVPTPTPTVGPQTAAMGISTPTPAPEAVLKEAPPVLESTGSGKTHFGPPYETSRPSLITSQAIRVEKSGGLPWWSILLILLTVVAATVALFLASWWRKKRSLPRGSLAARKPETFLWRRRRQSAESSAE